MSKFAQILHEGFFTKWINKCPCNTWISLGQGKNQENGFVNHSETEIQQNGLCKSSSSTQDVSPNHLENSK